VSLSGAVYGRGSGAQGDGTLRGGAAGLAPNFYNWGVGLTVAVPLLDFKAVRARTAAALADVSLAQARGAEVTRELGIRQASARAEIDRARRVDLLLTPQLEATRTTEQQILTRYRVGLATIADVADAQRLLAQTESDAAVARLAVWLALLHAADAGGDLSAFIAATR
ncbi:MAG: TolC family protein, partial [Chloroflexota bacterium]|nr:TolC family protein [Chloroflexota bacterium]